MHSNKDSGTVAQANPTKPLVRSTTSVTASTVAVLNTKKTTSASDLNSLKGVSRQAKQRRKEITLRPNYSINLWSIMKNCIGKDLSKIPIPVNFSEPLSMLQRYFAPKIIFILNFTNYNILNLKDNGRIRVQ